MKKWLLTGCSILLLGSTTVLADPRDLEVFTSFEPPEAGPVFGSGPVTATFSGGSARTVGDFSLYHSGLFSWEVPAGVTTLVEFSVPAQIVEFFALDTGVIDATVAAFDTNNELVDEISLTSSFSSPPGNFSNPLRFTGAIARLEFDNPGFGSAWIDDFGFSPVEEAALPGDFNGDGVVDAADYTVWRDGLGEQFDAADYDTWKSNFGATDGSAASLGSSSHAAVPEPASLLVLVIGAAMLGRCRCGRRLG